MASETVSLVVRSIREHRERFERFCRSLSEEELSRPVPGSTWIVKDFISHLGALDPAMGESFKAAAAGRPDEVFHTEQSEAFGDIDAWNDARVAERRGWPLERIQAEAATNRAALIQGLEGLSEEQLQRELFFTGDNKRSPARLPLRAFLLGWSLHDPIHAADMLKALPERSGDAELAAWVGHPVVKGYQAAMSGPARRSAGSG